MSHARRFLRAWGAAIGVGVLPAAVWGWRAAAPAWYNAAQALIDATVVSVLGAALAVVALVAARAREDRGQRAAVRVAIGAAVVLWATLLYVQIRHA